MEGKSFPRQMKKDPDLINWTKQVALHVLYKVIVLSVDDYKNTL